MAAASLLRDGMVTSFFFGLSAALSVALGVNFIAVDAAIFTGAPVCGLRPVRAARLVWLKEPKPGHAIFVVLLGRRRHVVEERTDRALGVRLGHAGGRRDCIDELCLGCHGSSFECRHRATSLGVSAGRQRPSPVEAGPNRTSDHPIHASIDPVASATTRPKALAGAARAGLGGRVEAARSVSATAAAWPAAYFVRGQKKPRRPSPLRPRHDVHVEVGDALADDVVVGDERALRAERVRHDRRDPLHALEERPDRGRARAASRRGRRGRPGRDRGTAVCGRGRRRATSSRSTTSAGAVPATMAQNGQFGSDGTPHGSRGTSVKSRRSSTMAGPTCDTTGRRWTPHQQPAHAPIRPTSPPAGT